MKLGCWTSRTPRLLVCEASGLTCWCASSLQLETRLTPSVSPNNSGSSDNAYGSSRKNHAANRGLLSISREMTPSRSTHTELGKLPKPLLVEPDLLPSPKSVRVFGQKIVYYDVSSGPAVVLLHGLGSQATFDWGHVIGPLSEGNRVITLDQIGFGESDKPVIDYSIQTFVDFLGQFLRVLRVQQFTLAGVSFGGWIAASYTIQALGPTNNGAFPLLKPERLSSAFPNSAMTIVSSLDPRRMQYRR
jgi:hypothetical protein